MSIDTYCFDICPNLSDVYYAGTQAEAEAIQIGTGNTSLTAATWHFTALPDQALRLPESLGVIEREAFAGVDAQAVVVPASVEVIESQAFANSPRLRLLRFEGSPASIADDVLLGCEDVVIQAAPGSAAETWALENGYAVTHN